MGHVKRLQAIGFKEEEAEIYLACLRLGMAKVSDLAKELDIPRTSIYVYVENLLAKGYLKKSRKQSVEHFVAIDPSLLLDDIQEKAQELAEIVPQLEKLTDLAEKKPKVEYFDTVQGMFKLYESFQKMDYRHVVYGIESGAVAKSNIEIMGEEYWTKWQKGFLRKGVVTQGIITRDMIPQMQAAPAELKRVAFQRPSTTRVIDEQEFPFGVSMYLIYPDKVFVAISQEKFMLKIENKALYGSLVTLYQLLYEKGEPFDPKSLV